MSSASSQKRPKLITRARWRKMGRSQGGGKEKTKFGQKWVRYLGTAGPSRYESSPPPGEAREQNSDTPRVEPEPTATVTTP